MAFQSIQAISPHDGRYAGKTEVLRNYVSEHGLIKYRVHVEIEWLLTILKDVVELPTPITESQINDLRSISENFSVEDSLSIKKIEATTNHDVKACEYFIKDKLAEKGLDHLKEWVHFACTSEDINNVAYALMLKDVREQVICPEIETIISSLKNRAHEYAQLSMLSRTHGQLATPTTLGKEFANIVYRLTRLNDALKNVTILAKMNGAVGNFNAHLAAYPDTNWIKLSRGLIESLNLHWNPYTTQIEPHDWTAAYFDALKRVNVVLIDFSRDVWTYISMGYFSQKQIKGEVGSSTMPHKINPIDFENAEGNLGLSNALCEHFSSKLPISRLQRDLSDSTVFRSVGSALSYTLIATKALQRGLNKMQVNEAAITADLENCWVLLAEPIQTILRKYGHPNPYEALKDLTRGHDNITKAHLHDFIDNLDIADDVKAQCKALTPVTYIGEAGNLAQHI